MKNLVRISAAALIVAFGILTIPSEKIVSSIFFNASAQSCMSPTDCSDGVCHAIILETTYCCADNNGETGHKQGIALPHDPTP